MAEGELVPDDVTKRELLDESHLRASRAGFCTRDGKPIPRKVQSLNNWGRPKFNVWPRDAEGNLIEG
jgi:hypothetical protein